MSTYTSPLPVSIVSGSIPLPVGAATALNQASEISYLTAISAALAATLTVQGSITANIGTTNGLALDATLATLSGKITACDTGAVVISSGTVTVQQSTAANLKVDLSGTGANATALKVDGTGGTFPISGSISNTSFATTQGTSPWVVSGTVTTSGTVTADQGTGGSSAWKVDGTGGTFPISGSISNTAFAVTQSTSPWVISGAVTTSGTVTANAGTNLNTSALALETGGNLATIAGYLTPKSIKTVTGAISATTTIVNAVTAKRIKVVAMSLLTSSTTAVTVTMKSGANGTGLWTVPMQAISGTNFGVNLACSAPSFLFATAAGALLEMSMSTAQTVTYSLSYFDDDAS